jgi:hypothetical protein
MALSRRGLAKAIAAAAVAGKAQAQQAEAPNPDLDSARQQMRSNVEQITKVKVPMATEPAFQFKA